MSSDFPESEIDAYLDGELDLDRQLAVETYLAAHAEAAASVLETMRTRTALRLLQADALAMSPALTAEAGRLARQFDNPPRIGDLRRMFAPLAAVGLVAALLAVTILPSGRAAARAPAFVSEAHEAYEAATLRAMMRSQPKTVTVNKPEILRATSIPVPELPAGWQVTDVQIVPSDDGPALQLMIDTREGQLAVFAVRATSEAPQVPETRQYGDESIAFWRNGEVAYALTGTDAPAVVDRIAEDFAAGVTPAGPT